MSVSPVHQRQSTQRQTETTSTVSFQLALYTHFNRYMQAYTQGQTDGQTDRQTNRRTETTSTVSFHLALLYTFQHIHLETDRQTQAETQTDRRKDTHGDRQTDRQRCTGMNLGTRNQVLKYKWATVLYLSHSCLAQLAKEKGREQRDGGVEGRFLYFM